jgi:hypothetical protein
MPGIDWDKFDSDADEAIENAANAADANKKIASRLSSLTRLSDDEIAGIIASPADAKTLASLMKIVQSATDHNTKINRIIAGGEDMVRIFMKVTETVGSIVL